MLRLNLLLIGTIIKGIKAITKGIKTIEKANKLI